MPCIDKDRSEQYLTEIKESMSVLKALTSAGSADDFMEDQMKIRAMKYTIVVMVEAMCNLFRHILAKRWQTVVEEYMDAVIKIREKGGLSRETSERLIPLTKLRHQLIHGYWKTDDRRLFEETKNNLDAIENLLSEIKLFLKTHENEHHI